MWELVSDSLDGEKLPASVSQAINALAQGEAYVVLRKDIVTPSSAEGRSVCLQPIETAPTDGTVFLGYRQRDGRWGECFRIQRDDCEMWSFGGGCAADEEFPDFKPTHWMPLPAETPAS